jgi:serine/threonine protein kinase/Tol biopolymer transport system component
MIGQSVLHYRILELIGQGGMGIVYKAEDTRLGRLVALKFLSQAIASDHHLARFRQEARTASALNHPNICTIYGFDEWESEPFIVMELLEGTTLKELIAKGPLDINVLLRLAIEIGEALEAAHRMGVLHRDIKPANIFISSTFHVKVLDFGLAKFLLGQPLPEHEVVAADGMLSATTIPGDVVGTVAYMSPEQARGERLDPRTDLFSLGSVLYEMATGRRAFQGSTNAIIFNDILNSNPISPRRFEPRLPAAMEDILHRLHVKERSRRYQTAGELVEDLRTLQRRLETTETSTIPTVTDRSRRWLVGLGLITVLIASVAYLTWTKTSQGHPRALHELTFTQITSQDGPELFPNLFPDARSLVYAGRASGNWDIFFQRVGGQTVVNLTRDSPADDTQPALSPDGQMIAFRSERDGGGIYIMGSTGESCRRLTDFGYNPAWSPDGSKISFAEESVVDSPQKRFSYSRIWTVDVATGVRKQISNADGVQPNWSPHGRRIAYWMRNADQRDVWTMKPDGTDPVPVTSDASLDWSPAWSADGKYLYFSSDRAGSSNLWRVRIDEESGRTLGPLEPFTTGGGLTVRIHAKAAQDAAHTAYVEQMMTENLYRVAFDPVLGRITGESSPVTSGMRLLTEPDLSPDGEWVAFCTGGPQEDIVTVRVDGSSEVRITQDSFKDRVPRWSPDGRKIAFYSDRTGPSQVWVINRDGSGLKQVTQGPSPGAIRSVWSPDGRKLASTHLAGESFIIDLDESLNARSIQQLPALDSPDQWFDIWSWSPDGKWLAGRRVVKSSAKNLGVTLFSLESGKYVKLLDFGESARWLQDNQRLLFLDDGKLYLVDRRSGKVLPLLTPAINVNSFAIASDNRTLYFTAIVLQADIWLITEPQSGRRQP